MPEAVSPVVVVAGEESDFVTVDEAQLPIPVELDFVEPLRAVRRCVVGGSELRFQDFGQRGSL